MTGSLLTASEVAELLGVPVSWVYEQSRRGRIPTVALGRYRRYRREAIEGWVEELEGRPRNGRMLTGAGSSAWGLSLATMKQPEPTAGVEMGFAGVLTVIDGVIECAVVALKIDFDCEDETPPIAVG